MAHLSPVVCNRGMRYSDLVEELADLRWHWGSAYVISHPGPDVWTAQRRDTRKVIRCAKSLELLEAIRADYARKPVPRPVRKRQPARQPVVRPALRPAPAT